MSKKCCGILHSEDEKVCRVCGKPLNPEDVPAEAAAPVTTESDNQADKKADIDDAEIEAVINAAMEAVSGVGTGREETAVVEEAAVDGETAAVEEAEGPDGRGEKRKIYGDRAPRGLKVMGILSIIMSVLGLAAVTLGVLFLVLFPNYEKEGAADRELRFESASASDAEPRPLLVPTDTEIAEYFSVQETATGTDATPADASE